MEHCRWFSVWEGMRGSQLCKGLEDNLLAQGAAGAKVLPEGRELGMV